MRRPGKSGLLLISLLFRPCLPATGQVGADFSGYVQAIPAYQHTDADAAAFMGVDSHQTSALTRLRLRPELFLGDDARLSLDYEADAFYHSMPVVFVPREANLRRQVVDLFWTAVNEDRFALFHFIDRLFYRQGFSAGEVIIGRQRVAWGTGRIWNPTDLFNPLAPTSFAKLEKDGIDAATAKLSWGNFTDLSLVCNPQRGWDTVNIGGRFRTNMREFDLSLMGGAFDRRVVAGADFAGNLFDAGVRGEGILSVSPESTSGGFVRYILGLDYQFSADLYALLEFQFNGEGASDPAAYDLQRLAQGEILNVARHYVGFQTSYLLHPLITISGSAIANLDDGSCFFGILATYGATDEISLALGGQLFLADPYDEYWYSPDTIYMKADLYF